jgi:phosphoglycolate phosphatase
VIKAVIFDFDDTLVKTYDSIFDKMKVIADNMGVDIPHDDIIRGHWGKSFDDFAANVFPSMDANEFTRNFMAVMPYLGSIPQVDNAMETIETISDKFVTGILTGGSDPIFKDRAKSAGINLDRFSFVLTADDNEYKKPDPRAFDNVFKKLDKLSIEKDEILYVGDCVHDFRMCKAAGINFVAVLTGPTSREQLISAGVDSDHIINSVSHLPRFIETNGFKD